MSATESGAGEWTTGHAWVDGRCFGCGAESPRPWAEPCPATESGAGERAYVWTPNDQADHDAGHPSGFDCDGCGMGGSESCGHRYPATPDADDASGAQTCPRCDRTDLHFHGPTDKGWPACATYPNLGCVCRGGLNPNKSTCTRRRTGDLTPIPAASTDASGAEVDRDIETLAARLYLADRRLAASRDSWEMLADNRRAPYRVMAYAARDHARARESAAATRARAEGVAPLTDDERESLNNRLRRKGFVSDSVRVDILAAFDDVLAARIARSTP